VGPKHKETKNLFIWKPLERFCSSHICPRIFTGDPTKIYASQPCPPAVGRACRRRRTAGAGKQMPQVLDLTHHRSIGGGGLAGDGSGERRRSRFDSDFGEMWGRAKPFVVVRTQVGARE
jgi:hypothetical protein